MKIVPLSEVKQLITNELYINGQFQPGSGTTAISVTNPFDNEEICRVAPASEAQVQDAIKAGITPASSPGDPFGVFRQGQGQVRHHAVITRYDGKTAFL